MCILKNKKKHKAPKKSKNEQSVHESQLLSIISHELRTPLNAIISLSNSLYNSDLSEEQLENLNLLQFSSNHLLGIINDILDFNKIRAGKLELDHIPFMLVEICKNVLQSFKEQAKNKGIELVLHSNLEEDLYLEGDPKRLIQVFNNLISNAVKFTEKGEVILTINLCEQNENKARLFFSVKDSGIGIEESNIHKIFDEFSQVSAAINTQYGGTGLGLTICKSIIEQMSGELKVRSKQSKGTEFYFTLDLDRYIDLESSLPQKVLLVEDNLINVKIVESFFQKWGIEYVTVNNGADAIDKINNDEFGLIFMDLQMPVLDGFETTGFIRKQLHDNTPIIGLTAEDAPSTKKKVKEVGMNDLINKPFSPEKLKGLIKKYL